MFSVLFVEDDVDFSAELAEYLSRYCIVAHFMTRIEGLGEKLQEVRPDILVLDQFIVGRDTLLEIPKIRAHFGGGIVVFTGNLNAVDRIVGLECGADDFISKQCDSREFVARLRAVLRRVKSDEAPQTQAAAPQPGGLGCRRDQWQPLDLRHHPCDRLFSNRHDLATDRNGIRLPDVRRTACGRTAHTR